MSKKLSKCVAAFDYIDKILIVLSTTSGGVSIISFPNAIGVRAWISSTSFTVVFSLTTEITKKRTKQKQQQQKKTDLEKNLDLQNVILWSSVNTQSNRK